MAEKLSSLFYLIPYDRQCEVIASGGFGFDRRELTSAEIIKFNINAIYVEIYGNPESYITRDIIPQNSYPLGSVIVNCYFNAVLYEKGIKYLTNKTKSGGGVLIDYLHGYYMAPYILSSPRPRSGVLGQ